MSWSFVGSSTATINAVSSAGINTPGGVQVNDIEILVVSAYSNGNITLPTGFTPLGAAQAGTASPSHYYAAGYRVVPVGDPGTYTASFASSSTWGEMMLYVLRESNGAPTVPSFSVSAGSSYSTSLPDSSPQTVSDSDDATVYVYTGINSSASGVETLTLPSALSNPQQSSYTAYGGVIGVGWAIDQLAPGGATATTAVDHVTLFIDLHPAPSTVVYTLGSYSAGSYNSGAYGGTGVRSWDGDNAVHDWVMYIRDPRGVRQGIVEDYISATLQPMFNDSGQWQLTIDRRSPAVPLLAQPGWGIEVVRPAGIAKGMDPVISGPATGFEHRIDASTKPQTNQLVITGASDTVWLSRRVCQPDPTSNPTLDTIYTTLPYDTVTSVLSSAAVWHYVNANLGPGATAPRQLAGLSMAADPALGISTTYNARFDNLLTLAQTLSTPNGIGFKIVANGNGTFTFSLYAPTNRSSTMHFSVGLGNVVTLDYTLTAPRGSYAYVLGSGSGAAQLLLELNEPAGLGSWGRIEEQVSSNQSTATSGTPALQQMTTDGNFQLAQDTQQATLALTPIERAGYRYGIDYQVGDIITAQLDSSAYTPYGQDLVTDILRSVNITLQSGSPSTVVNNFGSYQAASVNRVFTYMKQLSSKLNYLGRR